jgi:RNA polymerase sigma factor for flagellar operon FliA
MRPKSQEEEIRELWRQYKAKGRADLRNRLMERYLPIVRYNAERISVKLPDEVDVEDLMSAGVFGLMDAIEAYDLARGVKFETYCAPRIRGAILDELRSMDWVPRLVRARASKLDKATRSLQVELGRRPSQEELAGRMGIHRGELDRLLRDANTVTMVSLSRKHYETDNNKEVAEIDVLEDRRGRDPVRDVQRRDLRELVTRGLSRAERLLLILYYYEEMTMKEIGATLDLSESRVSQMHSSILSRLKAQLSHRKVELSTT